MLLLHHCSSRKVQRSIAVANACTHQDNRCDSTYHRKYESDLILFIGLEGVEKNLTEQISYLSQVSTNQQHEGSIYSEEKRFQLVCESTDSILYRLKDIEKKYSPKKEQK